MSIKTLPFPSALATSPPGVEGFRTTRGSSEASFWDTVKNGAAPKGKGLYMPPEFDGDFFDREILPLLQPGRQLTPAQIGALIVRKFIPRRDIYDEELSVMMEEALNFEIPLEPVSENTFVLRLDRGPTASFKDIAARTLAFLMEKFCETHHTHLNLIVATSGDTGVAVADAFGNKKDITVTIMYPHGGISSVQEAQMLDAADRFGNVQALAVKGSFDDAQNVSKILQSVRGVARLPEKEKQQTVAQIAAEIKTKLERVMNVSAVNAAYVEKLAALVEPLNLSSANSINIWRLIPQMTQYFVAYQAAVARDAIKPGEEVVFSVPSGNAGHLTAGLFARKMGLPVKRFLVGTNANNILANMIGRGVIQFGGFKNTAAPSMDIEEPNNVERILKLFADERGGVDIDFVRMGADMKEWSFYLQQKQQLLEEAEQQGDKEKIQRAREDLLYLAQEQIPLTKYRKESDIGDLLDDMQELIWAEDVESDEELYGTMAFVAHSTVPPVILEPHGAAAMVANFRARCKNVIRPDDKVIVLETAHPDKFPEALSQIGLQHFRRPLHPALEALKGFDRGNPEKVPLDLMDIARRIGAHAKAHMPSS